MIFFAQQLDDRSIFKETKAMVEQFIESLRLMLFAIFSGFFINHLLSVFESRDMHPRRSRSK